MSESVTLHFPEAAVERFRRSAAAAGKSLEEFLADRLADAIPPMSDDLPRPLQDELRTLEGLDDVDLRAITRQQLSDAEQREYDELISAQATGLSSPQQETLEAIGEKARLLSLKKAHAWMLLKWRGHDLPPREDLREVE